MQVYVLCAHEESNLNLILRRDAIYPLNYGRELLKISATATARQLTTRRTQTRPSDYAATRGLARFSRAESEFSHTAKSGAWNVTTYYPIRGHVVHSL